MQKIVSYNVNGLRAHLRRPNAPNTLSAFLSSFGDDVSIIAVQETKLSKSELDSQLALADGWCVPPHWLLHTRVCSAQQQPPNTTGIPTLLAHPANSMPAWRHLFAARTARHVGQRRGLQAPPAWLGMWSKPQQRAAAACVFHRLGGKRG